jgi:hypothetical protein
MMAFFIDEGLLKIPEIRDLCLHDGSPMHPLKFGLADLW